MKYAEFLAPAGGRLDLADYPTDYAGAFRSKDEAEIYLAQNARRLAELQEKLYAQNVHALLIIFQAMDAAGKDGTIEHVLRGVNP